MASGRSTALYGQLQVFTLNTILSALNLQKVTGHLTLAQYDRYAQILIKEGEVVDAWSETERGLNALLPLFGWEEGFFSFDLLPVETRTINISLPVLQVRSAVYMEEQKATKLAQAAPIAPQQLPPQPQAQKPNPQQAQPVLASLKSEPITSQPRSKFTREIPGPDYILGVNQDSDNDVTILPQHWGILRYLVSGPRTVSEMAELTGMNLEVFVDTATQLVRGRMLRVYSPQQR
ncbi:DUF4388 domain-containing protein [Candidatus Chlorohelix sp.]|uniref:DUF4388 domain-containing protein n=1 Tax=Candidatus Chlorohelix sp. TaxID=3139201 RepID=UPI003030F8D8